MSEMFDDETIRDFVTESSEGLEKIEADLLNLEKSQSDSNLINSLFRVMHSIKGASGFFGFKQLEEIAHKSENVLAKIRSQEILITKDICDVLLESVDKIKFLLECIQNTKVEGEHNFSELVETLKRIENKAPGQDAPTPQVLVKEKMSQIQPKLGGAAAVVKQESSVRIDVDVLEKLMNLSGELTLANNRIFASSKGIKADANFSSALRQLSSTTSLVSEIVMKTRLQPVGTILNKMPRIVRDLAGTCKKKISVEIEGENTELDRAVLELIKDPLTHIVRNSVDHGIESPEVRIQNSKSEEGKIRFKAYNESGCIVLEINDDGAGVNVARVKVKALEKGLISQEQFDQIDDQQAANLIFKPGFSTAEQTSTLSGRGVGMDVVKSNIESLGGQVEMSSFSGKGMSLKLKVPLTTAVMPALLFGAGDQYFAISQNEIQEVVTLEENPDQYFEYRGQHIPVVRFSKIIQSGVSETKKMIVVRYLNTFYGILCESISHIENLVVKSLDPVFNKIELYSGSALLGSGRIALIVDLKALAKLSKIVFTEQNKEETSIYKALSHAKSRDSIHSFLVFELPHKTRAAVPVLDVHSVGKVNKEQLQIQGSELFLKWRSQFVSVVNPLGAFKSALPESQSLEAYLSQAPAVVSYIMLHFEGSCLALLVERILDSHSSEQKIQESHGPILSRGVLELGGAFTDIIDLKRVINSTGIRVLKEAA